MFKVFSPGFDATVNSPFHISKRIFQHRTVTSFFGIQPENKEMHFENRKLVWDM
jgi:hypothetical protein